MEKELGGYLELEEFHGQEYYSDLYHVNLGRTALLWLLKARSCTHLYVPYFLCDSVTQICEKNGIELTFYHLSSDTLPILPSDWHPQKGEYLYLVNYYGQLSDRQIQLYRQKYQQIIIDHTHAFFQKPLPGIDTLYSCRKFFGVSDGAYLSTDAFLSPDIPMDHSHERMGHILGRYEMDAGTFYQQMLKNAAAYHHEEIRKMSRLTTNLLKGIDYSIVKEKREDNYTQLKELLPSESPFTRVTPEGPFTYPYFHPHGSSLRKWLISKKIFVPTYWNNVIQELPACSLEHQWAANILPLPCDQRYGKEEMKYIASSILEWESLERI